MPPEDSEYESILRGARKIVAPAELEAYLDQKCGDDSELKARVTRNLASATTVAADHSPSAARLKIGLDEQPGDLIGPYKLLEPLGQGGFGTVWRVEQRQPVSRHVALKIIKLGMDTREVIARFEAERQALALMEHPNIASVYDAGTTETGRPYFAMELVRGIPVTEFCDEQRLGINARLEIFIDICAALNHAHQKGVIHRDIKPSNVLVTTDGDRPVPKIIDFGIAKAAGSSLTDQTLFTRTDQIIGTPLYMSPEQLASGGVDIDTRSDIYSLGALLYECLTGLTPFDPALITNAGFEGIRRTIREQDPRKPSTRIAGCSVEEKSRLGHARHTDFQKLGRQLKGDIDWIVLKAMEKDRSRRYETANALMLDIRHFLADEEVSAAPPSATYRLQRIVRRHRGAIATASIVVLALLVGTVLSLWQAREARQARDLANRRQTDALKARNAAEETLEFLLEAFESADSQTTITTVLDRAASQLGDRFTDLPATRIKLLTAVADAHSALQMNLEAEPLRREAITLAQQLDPPDPDLVFDQQLKLCIDIQNIKRSESEHLARGLLDRALSAYGESDIRTLTCRLRLAILELKQYDAERSPENETVAGQTISTAQTACTTHLGATHEMTLSCLDQLASLRILQGKPDQAAEIYAQLLELRSADSEPPLSYYEQLLFISSYHQDLHQHEKAEPFARRALDGHTKLLGDTDPRTSAMRSNLAWILVGLGDHDEASQLFSKNLDVAALTPENFLAHASAISTLAHYQENRGNPRGAIDLHRQALEIVSTHLPEEHAEILNRLDILSRAMLLLAEHGDLTHVEEAASLADRIYKLNLTRRAGDPSLPEPTQLRLATALRLQGKTPQAEALLDSILAITADQPLHHPFALSEMVLTKIALKNYQAASVYAEELAGLSPAAQEWRPALRQAMLEAINRRSQLQPGLFGQQRAAIGEGSEDHNALAQTASIIAFAPTSPAETISSATALAERAFAIKPTAFNSLVLAALKVRTGQPNGAVDLLAPQIDHASWLTACPALAISAIASHKTGNLEESARLMSDCQQRQRSAPRPQRWDNVAIDQVLLVDLCMAIARENLSP